MIRRLNCPICEKELPLDVTGESAIFPFCSERCKRVDFYRWTNGEYAIVEQLTPEKLFEQIAKNEESFE